MKQGLTSLQADENLKTFGYNELSSEKPKNMWNIAKEVMKEPMFSLLIGCGILYMILGDYKEGGTLLSTILLIIIITYYQYRKTERALEALKLLSSPKAKVIRNNVLTSIAGREVVPDDIILINEGDRIAADGLLMEANHLCVDESLLTGESMPVNKFTEEANSIENKMVFSGTLVVRGNAIACVSATGNNTRVGKIGQSLKSIEQETTRLQKELKSLIRKLLIAGIAISVMVVIAFYISRNNFIQALLSGLASAMAILPEEFPVVITVFMALGGWRLSKKNILTRNSSAIETLGSATVLCADKTGTITQNNMSIIEMFSLNNETQKITSSEQLKNHHELIDVAFLSSPKNTADPMEKAISIAYHKIQTEEKPYELIKEYPLSREWFVITRVVKVIGELTLKVFAKGAPESIIQSCALTREVKDSIKKQVNEMASKGLRVIAVAQGTYSSIDLPETANKFELNFIGLIGFEDPIRKEVAGAIEECKKAGIKVVMITGDFPITARSIATQAGLDPDEKLVTGEELNNMSDKELIENIKKINVFARVIPEQKLRIVKAFQANSEIVAMTGDGINDAPALKAADIGIAMGKKGTDVAREASAFVLLDDNFASIVAGIRAGRKIYDNLQKAMSYIMAIHVPIIGLSLIPAFIKEIPILLMPLHIVFMELIIDPVCSVAFESENEEKNIMSRLPKTVNEPFFGNKKIIAGIVKGFLLLLMVLFVYFFTIHEGHTDEEIRAITFSSLIIGNIFLILTSLSTSRSFIYIFTGENKAALLLLFLAIILLLLILFVPSLQQLFSFGFLGIKHFWLSISSSIGFLLIFEFAKWFRYKKLQVVEKTP